MNHLIADEATREWLGEQQDRFAIHQQVLAYCRSVDRRDFAGVRAVYAADGVDHHTGFEGHADAYVQWLRDLLPSLDGTQHSIANHLCHLFGDEAVSETYGQATHWGTPSTSPHLNFTSGFRYVDHWVRTAEGWRIRERWAVREWARRDNEQLTGSRAHAAPSTEPDIGESTIAPDPFHALLERLGRSGH